MKQPLRIFIVTFEITVICVSFFVLILSKYLWGYYYKRPELDKRIYSFQYIESVTPLTTITHGKNNYTFIVDKSTSIPDLVKQAKNQCGSEKEYIKYGCLNERIIFTLDKLGRFPTSIKNKLSFNILNDLYTYLEETKLLEKGTDEYDQAKILTGVAIEAKGIDKKHYLFVAVHGNQVENDVYPYYEFLFVLPDDKSKPTLISSRHFRYEIAGVEGVEGLVIFALFTVLGMLSSISATTAYIFLTRRKASSLFL